MQVISKSELLQTLKEIQCQMYRSRIDGVGAVSWFSDIVNEQPVIEAAPVVHAKWEKDPNERRTNGHIYDYRCSECHGTAHKGYYGNKDYRTVYCHHCGAKMDLGEKEQ